MRCIDLFAGAGGLSSGFHQSGWDTMAAFELDASACDTYRDNFRGVRVIEGDVRGYNFVPLKGHIDAVIGGPPCQPFSVAGNQRSHLDPRDCVPMFIDVVRQTGPNAFVMENVAGLSGPRHGDYLNTIIREFEALGYKVSKQVLDAAHYGVPQHRKRLFIVGMPDTKFRFPDPTHGPGFSRPFVTAGEELQNVPEDIPNNAKVTYAKNPVLRPQPWDGMLVNGGGRPINLHEPCQTIPASAGGNRTHILDPDGVLVEYHLHLMNGGSPREGIVPSVRRLTVSESARIQSFHDTFRFLGTQSARYSQVGNAVPPPLAQVIAEALKQQIRGCDTDAYEVRLNPCDELADASPAHYSFGWSRPRAVLHSPDEPASRVFQPTPE